MSRFVIARKEAEPVPDTDVLEQAASIVAGCMEGDEGSVLLDLMELVRLFGKSDELSEMVRERLNESATTEVEERIAAAA